MRPLFVLLACTACGCTQSSFSSGTSAGSGPGADASDAQAAGEAGADSSGQGGGAIPSLDCTANDPACRAILMPPDTPDTSPFRGFADPSMRRDPVSGRLWMSYSWLHDIVGANTSTYVLDIHIAHSDDEGRSWSYDGPVWASEAVAGAADGASDAGVPYYSSHEVSNLYPIDHGDGTVTWVGVEKYYTVQQGGNPISNWQHFVDTGMLVVATADSPTALGAGPTQRLGAANTTNAIDVRLTDLSSDLFNCAQLDEPAFAMQGGTLYLGAFCASQNGVMPVYGSGYYAIFSTTPSGPPSGWTWKYEGKLATPADAKQLDGHQIWWELDFATKSDGTLLAIVTPTDQVSTGLVTHGCRVLAVASLSPPAMAAGSTNGFSELAAVTTSDLSGASGGQACTYEPTSNTGIVVFRYADMSAGTTGVLATLNATGLSP